ncbi:hypothetical protein [Burkholderia gladioli]|uniref:hypothetical protein n=1 Tax=Burkholderia gladioli TaxID=28095 RepID=UPI001C5FD365|nr:hypothetical protein [Burkholderia gladioli]MBW5285890.1 hypothetical protein [Burkholderia gladioli]
MNQRFRFPARSTVTALLAAGAVSATTPAHATDVVWDPGVNTTLVTGFTSTNSGLSGIIGELQSILSYLMGSTTGGNGLVETIASMNDKLAHANATADQNWAMNDTTDRRRRAETIVAQRRIARADDVGGCEETTAAGGRGAGSAATLASKLSIDADIMAKMTENQNGFTEKAEVLNRANYCSAQDVTNKRPGCSAVGPLPGADIELGTLTTPPTKDASTPTNVTLTPGPQQNAAKAVIRNVVSPIPPQDPPPSAAATPLAAEYFAEANVFRARLSAAADALSNIASIRFANPALVQQTVNGETVGQTWNDAATKTKYAQLFPGQPFPAVPSEWELLRYDVYSRWADAIGPDSWQSRVATMTQEETGRETIRLLAEMSRIQMLQVERQDDTNKILAALLSSDLDPRTRQQLEELRKTIH